MIEHYQKYFYAVHANTPELKSLAFRLRHQVYIKEYGDKVFKSGIKMDEYDNEALHALIFHRPTKKPVGCIRVIPYNEQSKKILPMDLVCNEFDKNFISKSDLRKKGTGEVTRMAIDPSFRRRTYDVSFEINDKKTSSVNSNRRMKINYLPLCLTLMASHLSHEAKLSQSLALMEPRLAKLLKMFNIQLTQIGDIVDFYGQRAPYKINNDNLFDRLRPKFQELYTVIGKELNFSKHNQSFKTEDLITSGF